VSKYRPDWICATHKRNFSTGGIKLQIGVVKTMYAAQGKHYSLA
jgi:hypothetical protein